jgi:hypothetical protein
VPVVAQRKRYAADMSGHDDQVFEAVRNRVATGEYLDEAPAGRQATLRPATPATVAEAEELAGRPLPPLLRRLYLEVGNGGFGPGYGLLGLRDGYRADGRNALSDWGCGISSELDLADGQVWGCDPNPSPSGVSTMFPQHMSIADWFAKWVDGTLHQPWLVQDPTTGEWRGATDAEYVAMIQDAGF